MHNQFVVKAYIVILRVKRKHKAGPLRQFLTGIFVFIIVNKIQYGIIGCMFKKGTEGAKTRKYKYCFNIQRSLFIASLFTVWGG